MRVMRTLCVLYRLPTWVAERGLLLLILLREVFLMLVDEFFPASRNVSELSPSRQEWNETEQLTAAASAPDYNG